LLVATFAAAAYANQFWLLPRLRRDRRFVVYGGSLLLVMLLFALACTAAIHLVYDLIRGPDPARFGFFTNLAMEFALVAFHVAIFASCARLMSARPGTELRKRPAFVETTRKF
jgi:hypothetical protein